jgi:hypothetical protein
MFYFFRKHNKGLFTVGEGFLLLITTFVLGLCLYYGAYTANVVDKKIRTSYVVSTTRKHDSHLQSYSCHCRHTGKTTTCSTCFRTIYTVDWFLTDSFNERVNLAHDSSRWSSVYKTPDPMIYTSTHLYDIVSKYETYMNYIKKSDGTILKNNKKESKYWEYIPNRPSIHSIFRVERVFFIGKLKPHGYSTLKKELEKQIIPSHKIKNVNYIVIVTDINDVSLQEDVIKKWEGLSYNDVLVFVGVDGNHIKFSNAYMYANNKNNELTQVLLRDNILDIKIFDSKKIAKAIVDTTVKNYNFLDIENYSYLKQGISLPNWIFFMVVLGEILIGCIIGACLVNNNYYEDE